MRVRVADTGDGIAAEDLPSVFERFWRADPSRSRLLRRHGPGLSIVRKLVEANGGRINMTSMVGEGTTFTIELPQAEALPLRPTTN